MWKSTVILCDFATVEGSKVVPHWRGTDAKSFVVFQTDPQTANVEQVDSEEDVEA